MINNGTPHLKSLKNLKACNIPPPYGLCWGGGGCSEEGPKEIYIHKQEPSKKPPLFSIQNNPLFQKMIMEKTSTVYDEQLLF